MSPESSDNQTLSFLQRRFREAGIRPQTRRGQNFLIDMNLQRVLLETAALGPDDVVLEIGTGTGGLTARMARQAAAVVTVEIDRQLFQLAGEELFDLDNVTMLQTDALRNKNRSECRGAGGGFRLLAGRARPPLQTGGQSALPGGHAACSATCWRSTARRRP